MVQKLVRYDRWHFTEVDPVCLKKRALHLRDEIYQKICKDADIYRFYSTTMPFIDAAIRSKVKHSLNSDEVKFIDNNYFRDKAEGTIPPEYDRDFSTAVAEFACAMEAMPLDDFDKVIIEGLTYGWVDFEEEADSQDRADS